MSAIRSEAVKNAVDPADCEEFSGRLPRFYSPARPLISRGFARLSPLFILPTTTTTMINIIL